MNHATPALPHVLIEAWEALGDPRNIVGAEETSPGVSTNGVYRLDLAHGDHDDNVFAKVSSYGSYVHFRQDHVRIARFIELLAGTRYEKLLAPVLCKNGSVFTYEARGQWVVFYGEVPRRAFLPRRLFDADIDALGSELASFHAACDAVRTQLAPTWKSLGSDIALLYDQLDQPAFCSARNLSGGEAKFLKAQCDSFLQHAELLGYHGFHHLPVLIDWNRGNFSVRYDDDGGFQLYSRWDYDWFRIEPRTLDFYFLARVAREEGDQSTFSYTADPLFEPRFERFLRAYHAVFPLSEAELSFLKEAYRFFVLNYVVRVGEHFFVPKIEKRLLREAVDHYLPSLETLDWRQLLRVLDRS
ncbi:MAG TPA: hypothetical protein VHM19_09505 [Polyangiales bacterium]|nr:hypothetical protein [Polyangiales bacterium]